MFKNLFMASLVFLAITSFSASAQELKATVTVNMDQLPFELRSNVSTMERDLTDYVNNQKFTDKDWEGEKIPVDITIYLSGGANNKYAGRLLIVSRRKLDSPGDEGGQSVTLKMYDQKWHFTYNIGQSYSYNPLRYDDFISLIDYYMNLIIGFDMDTYGELDGNKMFDAAKNIVTLGASSNGEGFETFSQPGDFSRYNLVNELTDMRYEPLRKLFFSYYVDGLDKMAFDKDKATTALEGIINDMAEFKRNKLSGPSVLLQAFFDTKNQELSTIFNNYSNKEVFKNLEYLDPGNTSLYEDAKDGKAK